MKTQPIARAVLATTAETCVPACAVAACVHSVRVRALNVCIRSDRVRTQCPCASKKRVRTQQNYAEALVRTVEKT